jgi:hypothetical protein
MAVGLPAKTTYANGDVFSASDINDTNGTLNLLNPTDKGSIVSASAANTPSRLAVGNNGQTLVADSSTATGLAWSNGAKRTTYSSTVSSINGTITTVGAVNNVYYRIGDMVFVEYDITITTLGTAGGAIKFTLPITNNRQNSGGGVGRENNVTGKLLTSFVDLTVATLVQQFDGAFVGGNNYRYQGFICYGAA